jgi:hypothetical protein
MVLLVIKLSVLTFRYVEEKMICFERSRFHTPQDAQLAPNLTFRESVFSWFPSHLIGSPVRRARKNQNMALKLLPTVAKYGNLTLIG